MTNLSLTFESAFEKTKKEVDRILITAPLLIKNYVSHLTLSHGKFVRARAVLACAMQDDGSIHNDAVIFASAIEILHLATLVHDDVMDDAQLRRGKETLQKKFGKRRAVICGDYLLAMAIKQLKSVEDVNKYTEFDISKYIEQICLGELRQTENNSNYNLSSLTYLKIINGKTAALFDASYFAGAVVSEKDKAKLFLYRKLGKYTGLIFQMTDDCIDYENDEKTALKSVQSDFEQGVITLPVIYTFTKNPDLREQAENQSLTVTNLINQVKEVGGTIYTHQIAKRYYNKAINILNKMNLSSQKAEILKGLLDKSYYGLKK